MQAILTRGALLSALVAGAAHAEPIALVGGDVYTVSGAMLPGATVVVDDGKIAAVGLDVAIPAGAKVIDVRGKRVTPGLIDVDTQLGILEIELEASTVDAFPRLADPIRAAVYAGDAVDPLSTLVGVARRHGVTSVVSRPGGGLVAGRGAWLDLVGPRSPELYAAVSGPVSLHVALGEGGAGAAGGSRALAVARLREAFDEARTYRAKKALYERGDMYDMRTSRLDLEALEPALRGKLPVIVEVSRAADILAALRLAKDEGLDLVILGAEEGWLVADALARAKVPVIVNPLADLPERFETRHARADNAALLAQAGVQVAISTRSSHNASSLRFLLGNAVRAGLPPELALRAATLNPAEMFGMGKTHGALERGKVANVVVWTGDPFEPSSYAETVIIRGEVQPTESRQTALARKYIQRVLK
jgi:imidazolonepropionase-like amidohydrolase